MLLICISLMVNDVEHFIMCLFAIFISLLMSVDVLCAFSTWILWCFTVSFESFCMYSLYINPLLDM